MKKRCEKCGSVSDVKARVRRCHIVDRPGQRFYCWGKLAKIERPKPTRPERAQDRAAAERLRCRKNFEKNLKLAQDYDKLAARARLRAYAYERKAEQYAKRAAMTDAEIEAERAARQERKSRSVRRAIAVGGVR